MWLLSNGEASPPRSNEGDDPVPAVNFLRIVDLCLSVEHVNLFGSTFSPHKPAGHEQVGQCRW